MTIRQIFQHLFNVAKASKDPEGVVAACLVKKGKILVSSASADDGVRHAEDLIIEKVRKKGIDIDNSCVLYTTLEPCSYRNPVNKVQDCTTIIINAGIKHVVFATQDPDFSKEAKNRFARAGVTYKQVIDKDIIRKSIELFNSTIRIPLTSMGLPRKKELPSN
jgi:pyrimidine deaminase RibD-like protein